jgi:peptidoglycan/LPS O-acetylase OafA/YrhL
VGLAAGRRLQGRVGTDEQMKQQGASFIDAFSGLRGLAALGVFIYHFHHVGYFEPITSRLPYFFKNGWFLVDLFFILSG